MNRSRRGSAPVRSGGGAPPPGASAPRAPTSPQRPGWRPGDREQVAVVSFSHTIQHSYVAVMGIVYPFALATFHVSYAVLGITLGVAGVCGGLMQGLAGIVKRLSARVLLGGQNLALALMSAIGSLAPSFAVFGLVRVMGSLVTWPQHPVGSAHLTDRVPHRRGFVLAAHTTGGNLGTLLAPLAASGVIVAFGWRWALAGTGMVMALCSAVTWTRVRGVPSPAPTRPPSPHTESSRADGPVSRAASTASDPPPGSDVPPAAVPPERPGSLRNALRRRQALTVLVAGTISGAGRGLGVLTAYVPAYLRSGLHEPALLVGAVTTAVGAGAVLGPLIGGHISDRRGRQPVLYTLYGCGALALLAFVSVGSSPVALVLVGLAVGVFSYSEQPLRQALFSDAMQGVSARKAFGAYFAISQSMGAVWVAILGVLITTSGFRATFSLMAASFVAAGLVIFFGCKERTVAVPSVSGPSVER